MGNHEKEDKDLRKQQPPMDPPTPQDPTWNSDLKSIRKYFDYFSVNHFQPHTVITNETGDRLYNKKERPKKFFFQI